MKTQYFILLMIALLYACDKFDYTDDENSRQNIDSYSTLEQAIVGTYAKFAEVFYGDYGIRNTYIYPCIFADDINPRTYYAESSCEHCNPTAYAHVYNSGIGFQTFDENGDTIYLNNGCNRDFDPNASEHHFTTENWVEIYLNNIITYYKMAYKAIISQNFILAKFPDLTSLNVNSGRIIGEVYFMRSYSYYRLTRIFGNIPLITDIDVDYEITRATFNEIYGQIKSDLLKAINLLPDNTDSHRVSTICPNKGSAKALLAEVYLTMGGFPLHDASKYPLAAEYARDVIENASVYGFGLLEDFAGLFNPLECSLHKEMVSAVQYKSVTSREDLDHYGYPSFNSNELGMYSVGLNAETKFINNYPQSYRKEITFNMEQTDRYYDTINYEWVDLTFYPQVTTTCYLCDLHKFGEIDWEIYFEEKEWYTVYILRYAHTLLTYAEASARSGNINALSYEAVNMIRRRANKLPINIPSAYDLTYGMSTEEFIDSVVWERAWEFVGEVESRWFDLLRLEMINDLDELEDPYEADIPEGIFNSDHFFSIPLNDIYLNPNLEF